MNTEPLDLQELHVSHAGQEKGGVCPYLTPVE